MAQDAFDRWWDWVDKPVESRMTIPAHYHRAIMALAPEDRRNRRLVNEAVRAEDPASQY